MAKIGIEVLTKIDDARSDLRKLDASVESVDKTVKDMAGSMKSAENSLSGFSGATANIANIMSAATNAIDMTQQVVGALKGAFDETIGAAAEWGDSMGDLASLTGQTVEETSQLAATMELVGIESGDLGRIMKSMTKEGLNLNLKTLLELNKQYNAIQDPVEKNAFLFKNFGKAAEDMAEVMGRSEAELKKLADTAAKSGKVIGEDAANAAETLNVQMAILNQKIEGAKINLGTAGIQAGTVFAPAIRDANNEVIKFIGSLAEANSPMALFAQFIAQGALVRDFANALDIQAKKVEEVTEAVWDNSKSVDAFGDRWTEMAKTFEVNATAADELNAELRILNAGLSGSVSNEMQDFYDKQGDLGERGQELRDEIDRLTASHGQYYQATIDSGISAAELEVATLKLAEAQHELSQETDPLKAAQLRVEIEKQQETISGATTVVEGYIDNSKEIGELSAEWEEVTAALEANRQAHKDAMTDIVFALIQQQYAVDGLSKEEIAALTEIGLELGQYDEKTAEVMRSVAQSIETHGNDGIAVITELQNKYDELNNRPDIVKTITIRTTKIGDEDFGGWTPSTGSGGSGGGTSTPVPLEPGIEQNQSNTPGGSTGGGASGSVNITINAGNATAADVAREVQSMIAGQVRQYGMAGV